MVRSDVAADRSAERTPLFWAAAAAAWMATASLPVLAQELAVQPAPTAPAADAVTLEADEILGDDPNQTLTAIGNVEARYQGRTLRADRIIYNLRDGAIRAQGNVQMLDADGSITYADELEVDEELGLGVATELQARVGEIGRIAARTAVRREGGESELSRVVYTSCPICEGTERPPTWELRARKATQHPDRRMLSYRDAVLEVAGVPVLYLPYFAHPDPSSGPTSGFLTPDLGRNRRLGAFYGQPYYWKISPYQDLTITPQLHQNVRPLLGLDYRKRFWSGDLEFQGAVTYEQQFDTEGDRFGEETWRGHVFGSGQFQISDYWLWGFGVERTSDDLYLRRYGVDGYGVARGPFLGDYLRLLSQLYVSGQDRTSYATVNFLSFQGLREFDDLTLLPLILPFGEVEHIFRDPLLDGQLRLRASTAVLERSEDGTDTARISAGVNWRSEHIVGPGLVVSPFAETRIDGYRIADPTAAEDEDTFTRSVGLAGVEVSWPFVRTGESVDLLIEPIASATYAVGENDPRIINEDSIDFELDDSNLFRPNVMPNYDVWETGGRLSLGVRATARTAAGNSANLLFGRRWRSEDDADFSPVTNLDGNASDWVAAGAVSLGHSLSADVRTRLEGDTFEVNRLEVGARGALGRFSASARYYNIDDAFYPNVPASQIRGTVGVELVRGWQASYSLYRDLDSDINLSQTVRAIYRDDCTFLELSYSRSNTSDRTLGPNEGFQIRIGLTSLGVFGGGS